MLAVENVIKRPLITEKVALATEGTNSYGFQVDVRASKHQVKNAVEKMYNVKVLKVNTSIVPGKVVRAGRGIKKTAKWKKALVQLENGQKIELFKGV